MIDSAFLKKLLLDSLKMAHDQLLDGTIDGVDNELANKQTPGNDNPIGTTYAHHVLAEDAIVNGMLKGVQPLSEGAWKDRTGVSKPMSMSDPEALADWYQTAQVDIPKVREFAKAVYSTSEEFITNANDDILIKEVDFWGMKMNTATAFENFVIGHCNSIAGEISALKGVAGLKGYPF
jgi:hypothetical protein